MTKKIFFIMFTVLLSTVMYTQAFASCSIWRKNNTIITVNKGDYLNGERVPTLVVGYSSDHIEDLSFTVTLTGAEWDYEKSGTITTGVTYKLDSKTTMTVNVDVGTSSNEFNFEHRNLLIPLYCKATQGGDLKFTVDGTDSTVSSSTQTFARCNDGKLTAGAKSARIGNIGELGTVWINDTSTQSFAKGKRFVLELDNSFHFTNPVEPVGTGKFENNCTFAIDSKDPSKAYVTMKNTTPNEAGKIELSGLVIERNATSKFNVVLMTISTNASVVELDTSFTVATYSDKATDAYTTTEATTEATTQAVIETTTEQATAVEANNNISIQIGATSYSIGDKTHSLDAPAFIANGSTMLPLRALANAFGISDNNISYDAETKTATLSPRAGIVVSITAGESKLDVNGVSVKIDSPAVIENNRIYLPLRAMANALGISNSNISFDNETKTVIIQR